jgi:hypothetical protein
MWITVDNFLSLLALEKIFIICYGLVVKIFKKILIKLWLPKEPINQILEKEPKLMVFGLECLQKTDVKY